MPATLTTPRLSKSDRESTNHVGDITISWIDPVGREHNRRASRRARDVVPVDAGIWPTARLDRLLFPRTRGGATVSLPDAVLQCERDLHLSEITACAVVISHDSQAYVVPIFARRRSGVPVVVELPGVPPPAFAREAAEIIGWHIYSLPELSVVERQNLRTVACDRHPRAGLDSNLRRVLSAATSPVATGTLCRLVDRECPARVSPTIGYALWHGLLTTDWSQPFTAETVVTCHVTVPAGVA